MRIKSRNPNSDDKRRTQITTWFADDSITDEVRDDVIKTKGYFLYPSQLFENVVANANNNENLNTDLKEHFTAIESSVKWSSFLVPTS